MKKKSGVSSSFFPQKDEPTPDFPLFPSRSLSPLPRAGSLDHQRLIRLRLPPSWLMFLMLGFRHLIKQRPDTQLRILAFCPGLRISSRISGLSIKKRGESMPKRMLEASSMRDDVTCDCLRTCRGGATHVGASVHAGEPLNFPTPLSPDLPFDINIEEFHALLRQADPRGPAAFRPPPASLRRALNWPAKADGTPDRDKDMSDNTSPRVWMSWRSNESVFKPDRNRPEPVGRRQEHRCMAGSERRGDFEQKDAERTWSLANELTDFVQAFTGPLVDLNGKFVRRPVLSQHDAVSTTSSRTNCTIRKDKSSLLPIRASRSAFRRTKSLPRKSTAAWESSLPGSSSATTTFLPAFSPAKRSSSARPLTIKAHGQDQVKQLMGSFGMMSRRRTSPAGFG